MDLFPENEYQTGLKQILQIVYKEESFLRSKPKLLPISEVNEMFLKYRFYERKQYPNAKGFKHKYKLKEIDDDRIVFDEIMALIWQQSGSSSYMNFENAKKYIDKLNNDRFAGSDKWRLPTLEEAMSLMESKKKNDLYIDRIFDCKQAWI